MKNVLTRLSLIFLCISLLSAVMLTSCATGHSPSRKEMSSAGRGSETVYIGENPGEYGSLAEALARAPETVTRFCLPAGIHTESGITVGRKAEIFGIDPGRSVLQGAALPGEAPNRIFTVQEGAELILKNITVKNGRSTEELRRGGGILNLGTLTIENCLIADNAAVYGAGLDNRGQAVICDTVFRGNYTLPRNQQEILTGIGCTGSGGGIKNEPGGYLIMENCEISGNSARHGGGGIFISCESRAVLSGCRILGNEARQEGGGIGLRGDLVLLNCTVTGNTAGKTAGGIHVMGRLDYSGNLIRNNFRDNLVLGTGSAGIYGGGIIGMDRKNRVD